MACAKQEEIAFPEHPPLAIFVEPSAAIERLAEKVAAMDRKGSVDCGEIGQRFPSLVALCATAAFHEQRPFYCVIRQSSSVLDSATRPYRQVVTAAIFGDQSGNVEMVSVETPILFGGGCGIGAGLPRTDQPPRVHVRVLPLMIAGSPTPAARTNILTTRAALDHHLEPADSRAPYDLPRQRFFASAEINEWGRVVSCDASQAVAPLLREPVCNAVRQWRYKPATFLGRRIPSTREIAFEIERKAIRTMNP